MMEEGAGAAPLENQPESYEEHDGIHLPEGSIHQIAYSDLQIGAVVGEGAYGVVMKGKYFGAKVGSFNLYFRSPQPSMLFNSLFFTNVYSLLIPNPHLFFYNSAS